MYTAENIRRDIAEKKIVVIHPTLQEVTVVTPPASFRRADPGLEDIKRLLQLKPGEEKTAFDTTRKPADMMVQWIPIIEGGTLVANVWCDEEGALKVPARRNVVAQRILGKYVEGGSFFGTIVIM